MFWVNKLKKLKSAYSPMPSNHASAPFCPFLSFGMLFGPVLVQYALDSLNIV